MVYTQFTVRRIAEEGRLYVYIYFDKNAFYKVVQVSGENTTETDGDTRTSIGIPQSISYDEPITMTYNVVERESGKVVQSFTIIYYSKVD